MSRRRAATSRSSGLGVRSRRGELIRNRGAYRRATKRVWRLAVRIFVLFYFVV